MDSDALRPSSFPKVEPWTPAHEAVELSECETLSVLLGAGADPDEVFFELTLLTHAIDTEGDSHLQSGHFLHTAGTAILLAYGADPHLPSASGETPLQFAESYDHEPAKRLLQRFLAPEETPERARGGDRGSCPEVESWTPAHKAVEMDDYETLAVLLDAGADPDEVCFGHTLLTHAIDLEGQGHVQANCPLDTTSTAILLA
ncbi:ankyrin repeat domain-containing protein [Streptomyces sp. NPDC003470]|uniref:ankyrin repeat domain-containing protein n=1 Tax=Streptomyces sp. NPDC127100 TaxID=3347138 RepID=UPI003646FDDA